MRNLIEILLRSSTWILFFTYIGVSIALLVNNNPYQQSVYLSSANAVMGEVYDVTGQIKGYIGLRTINTALMQRNAELEQELLLIKEALHKRNMQSLDTMYRSNPLLVQYEMRVAQVINNTVAQMQNYITIDKGSNDGIFPEMGVINQQGIVGIVSTVSERYSVIISLLNPKLRLSCKVKQSKYFGSLVWDGKDSQYALLQQLPRHVAFELGDTIVTSGYSAVFPEGMMVGTIHSFEKQRNDNFYELKVALSADFSRLSDVSIISNKGQEEQQMVERKAINRD